MASPKKKRGTPVVLPGWWLDEVNERFEDLRIKKRTNKVQLAAALTEAVKRDPAWDHKAVERFLLGTVTTFEMMWAFLRLWPSLVQPVFVAHTRRDAERITDELASGKATPEWRERYLELEDKLLEAAGPVLGQTPEVESVNEGQGEPRGAGRRRSAGVD